MAGNSKRTGRGRYTERAQFGGLEARISGKTMVLRNNRSPAEHEEFLARFHQWREQADVDFRARRDALLDVIQPYTSLALLGYVYFNETASNPETFREWEHQGLAAKVEHYALLLAARENGGSERIVPVEVSGAVDEYLNHLFANLAPYYDGLDKGGLPTDPDPRSLVLMWELVVRMPLYPWQHRSTLRQLFGTVAPWMERSLGFTIEDVLAVDLAFEQTTNAMLAREGPALNDGMERLRQITSMQDSTTAVAKAGHEEEARRLWSEYQDRWSATMARIGDGIALDLQAVASGAGIDSSRASAVLSFFTTGRDRIPNDYFIPAPDGPLKLRPFLQFEGRWSLPSSVLFLPAMQPALERALNPALGAASADKETWNIFEAGRADLVERRAAAALSSLLDGEEVHRNLKYKTTPGQKQPFELDGLALRDGKLILLECKAGAFSSAARRGDLEAVEGRITALVTDAHKQAVRALEYIDNTARPTFRVDGVPFVIDKADVEEVFLITTTHEELGFLTARFNEVGRLVTSTLRQTPWVVPLHDLELVAKYIRTAPEFIHYLKRRIALNAQRALGAFDELDWLGRYMYDALALADARRLLDTDPLATGSLASHKTEIDDYEHYENGVRVTPAPRPTTEVHQSVRAIIDGLTRWAGSGYIDAGLALLDLPPKQQRAFAKRVARAARSVRPGRYIQERAITDDREVEFICTISGEGVDCAMISDGSTHGTAKRSIHILVDQAFNVIMLRSSTPRARSWPNGVGRSPVPGGSMPLRNEE